MEDSRDAVRGTLNRGAESCDLVITSGGASAGDEDHISAILKSEGQLTSWRIALKPGRPLALGIWNETPVIELPAILSRLGSARWSSEDQRWRCWPAACGESLLATR